MWFTNIVSNTQYLIINTYNQLVINKMLFMETIMAYLKRLSRHNLLLCYFFETRNIVLVGFYLEILPEMLQCQTISTYHGVENLGWTFLSKIALEESSFLVMNRLFLSIQSELISTSLAP